MRWLLRSLVILVMVMSDHIAVAQNNGHTSFSAIITDVHGIVTEITNVHFYWEEKISETAFVPHELSQVPVKRGHATVNVRFDTIREIAVKPSSDTSPPVLTITLTSGKTGEFPLAIAGMFKGDSDFGVVELPAKDLKRVLFK